MISLSVRESLAVWSLVFAGGGAVLYAKGPQLGIPLATPAQLVLVWLFFAAILGRFVMLSVYAGALRARLRESRRRLAATLDQVQRLISHDELTRTLNRRSRVARLGEERSRSERNGASFSLALMDLDHFKNVNDTHGHAAGDAVLKVFSDVLRESLRDSDTAARIGGEEFAVLLSNTPQDEAMHALERVRAMLDQRGIEHGSSTIYATVSIGAVQWRPEHHGVDAMLGQADEALYASKRLGRNRVTLHSHEAIGGEGAPAPPQAANDAA